MLELAHSQVEKGKFELVMEGEGPGWARLIIKLGPVRPKLIALSLILLAASLNLGTAPAAFFMDQGWAAHQGSALAAQNTLKWVLAGLGAAVWLTGFMVRQEKLQLTFDRIKNIFYYRYQPQFALAEVDEGEVDFKQLRRIEVFSAQKEPQTEFGYIELGVKEEDIDEEKVFRFKVLSDEQFRFYPLNISRITGRTPIGDYVEEE